MLQPKPGVLISYRREIHRSRVVAPRSFGRDQGLNTAGYRDEQRYRGDGEHEVPWFQRPDENYSQERELMAVLDIRHDFSIGEDPSGRPNPWDI